MFRILVLFFLIFFNSNLLLADIISDIKVKGNNRVSSQTIINFSGKEFIPMKNYAVKYFGRNTESTYLLNINVEEKKTKRSIKSNQVVSKIDYELVFYYELFHKEKNCLLNSKSITSRFSHTPKSEGYDYGSDKALDELYKITIGENFTQYITVVHDIDFYNC